MSHVLKGNEKKNDSDIHNAFDGIDNDTEDP